MSSPTPQREYTPPEPNEKGQWPLHFAVMKNDPERILRYVQERGHEINVQDHQQNTPLHWAIWNRRYDVIVPLLELGADPNVPNHRGHTALHHLFAKIEGGQDRWLLGQLLDHKAEGLARDQHGNTPYHMLALGTFRSAQEAGALAQTMCERVGVEGWRTTNRRGLTPIECARQAGQDHWMLGFAAAIEYSMLETATAQVAVKPARRGGRL